jgi:hypothetical protein
MRGKDSSDRGEATGNNQPAQQKDEMATQHECQRNDSKATLVTMVTAMAAAMMVTTVAGTAAKTMAGTMTARGTINNQFKVAAEETAAVQWRWQWKQHDGNGRRGNVLLWKCEYWQDALINLEEPIGYKSPPGLMSPSVCLSIRPSVHLKYQNT